MVNRVLLPSYLRCQNHAQRCDGRAIAEERSTRLMYRESRSHL